MDGIRAGRVWVGMGGLLEGLDVVAFADDLGALPVTLGGRLRVRRGATVTVVITARLARRPNGAGEIPRLRRLDLIQGAVTAPSTDPDRFTVPDVRVVESFEPRRWPGAFAVFTHTFRNVRAPFYLRLRGTDGRAHAAGGIEPRMDVYGEADPWSDLWCYANPIFVEPR
jgi:hypothetical protein